MKQPMMNNTAMITWMVRHYMHLPMPPVGTKWRECLGWAEATFGKTCHQSIGPCFFELDPDARWGWAGEDIYFRDPNDALLFKLRWL